MLNPILRADSLAKSYGFHQVFSNVSFMLRTREKVALVGPNGIGKSTLLKILAGLEEPDSGTIAQLQEPLLCRYVPQMPKFELSTPWDVLTKEAVELGVLARGTPHEAMSRFGFSETEAILPTKHLSGGQKTRLALARAWLSQPDLLLLDEPTNHLDMAALDWLEGFVMEYPGCVFVVSHDRVFLDNVVSRVLELECDGITEYTGNYTAYREAKAQAFVQQMSEYEADQRRIRRLEATIDQQMRRFQQSHGSAGQHDFYRGKAKKLAKTGKAQMKRLESMKETSVAKPKAEEHISLIDFAVQDGGRRVVVAEELGKSYARELFARGNFSILRGDKVALVGPNGSGKTTLLKMILGQVEPSQGRLWVSPNVSMGYLDQEMDELNPDNTVLAETLSVFPQQTSEQMTRARTFLAGLLFGADDLEKSIRMLSVGEQKRVAMAKLLLGVFDLLLLDEPTDHLDLPSREKLEEALLRYDGTLILVSHDRYLLGRVSSKVIALDGGNMIVYPGGFREYEARQARLQEASAKPEALSAEERLLLETRLAQLGSDLAKLSKEESAYADIETEFIEIARRLQS
ncbi:MAG: ABC-F family ATP-binding cassette domain-containing protein [Firmicutes bacterium]|nr:ABC-F family ATP-binding cassette domain-containing protein [Bacillota bacterium]